MDTAIDIIGIGGAGGFLASSLHRGGLPLRIISRGMALRQLQEVGLAIVSDTSSCFLEKWLTKLQLNWLDSNTGLQLLPHLSNRAAHTPNPRRK